MDYHSKLSTLIKLEDLEAEAQQQIWDNLRHEFLIKMAIMPDCHTGYNLPIGGVALLDNVISPSYVGYDIGCGMCCIIFDIPSSFIKKDLKKIFDEIYRRIPVGFNTRSTPEDYPLFSSASGDAELNEKVNEKVHIQLGTLGSGNHFIELGETQQKKLALTVHSGSRNPGHSIASYYMKLSKTVDVDLPQGFLRLRGGIFGWAYKEDLGWALKYALDNRKRMLQVIVENVLKLKMADAIQFINENHNCATPLNTPHGVRVLHRKGATPADKGQYGVIPGNMKDGVFITRGLGNEEFLSSASHGAGRKMSRKKAKENIDIDHFKSVMKASGVMAKVDQGTLDEAPDAYKDLHKVIEAQEGVVIEVVDYIKPLINIKG